MSEEVLCEMRTQNSLKGSPGNVPAGLQSVSEAMGRRDNAFSTQIRSPQRTLSILFLFETRTNEFVNYLTSDVESSASRR